MVPALVRLGDPCFGYPEFGSDPERAVFSPGVVALSDVGVLPGSAGLAVSSEAGKRNDAISVQVILQRPTPPVGYPICITFPLRQHG
jgi:hypothetical protein